MSSAEPAAHRTRDRGASGDAGSYLRAAGIGVRPSGAWGRRPPANQRSSADIKLKKMVGISSRLAELH